MRLACVLGLLLAFAPLAQAADWPSVFASDAVSAPLVGSPRNLLVVGFASSATEAEVAAAALGRALTARHLARTIIGQRALGLVTGLDDAGLVARAQSLPVDAIAIVRLAPSGAATLVYYDRRGAQLGSLAVAPSGELRADEAEVARISAELDDALRLSPSSAQALYDQRFLDFSGWASPPFEGLARKRLSEPALYHKLGHPELAERHRVRRATRIGLVASGAVAIAGGVAALIAQIVANQSGPTGIGGFIIAPLIAGWAAGCSSPGWRCPRTRSARRRRAS